MATPLAHAAAGLVCLALVQAVTRSHEPPSPGRWLWCAVAGCAPDLDILVSWLFTGHLMTWHSGPTHTLAFAVAIGVLAAGLLPARRCRAAFAVSLGLAVASHVLVDYLTGPQWGWHPSYGVPAFWPWMTERLSSPLTLFRGVKHGSVAIWFTPHNLATAASELLFAIPALALSVAVLRRRSRA